MATSSAQSEYQFVIDFVSDGLKEMLSLVGDVDESLKLFEKSEYNTEKANEKLNDSLKDTDKILKNTNDKLDDAKKKLNNNTDSALNNANANNKVEGSLNGIFKKLISIGAIYSLAHKAMDFYNEGLQMDELAKKTGVLRDELQNIAQAGKVFNISTETTASSITKAQEYYKKTFGVSTTGENAYEAISKKMQGMSARQQYEFGASIGLDEGTIALLSQGVESYKEQLKEASNYKLFDEDDLNKMREYRQNIGQLRLGFNQFYAIMARALLPAVNAILKPIGQFFKFLSNHEGLVKSIALYAGLAGVLIGLPKIIGLITTAWKLLNTTFLGSPIGWVVAGITALFLIINDFINFLQGNNSVIEKVLKSWGVDVEKVRKTFNTFFNDVAKNVLKFIERFKQVLDLIERVRRAQFKLDDTANNNNNLNTLPAGSRLYSTPQDRPVNQSTFNDRPSNYSRTTNNNKNVNIATVNIQTQNMTPADIKRTISSIDNGIAG